MLLGAVAAGLCCCTTGEDADALHLLLSLGPDAVLLMLFLKHAAAVQRCSRGKAPKPWLAAGDSRHMPVFSTYSTRVGRCLLLVVLAAAALHDCACPTAPTLQLQGLRSCWCVRRQAAALQATNDAYT
jgi:hypothetical protein